MAAMSVPMWRATSKAFSVDSESKSSQPNSQGTSRRWPLDEMGRNSVSPWTIPRMMACEIGTRRAQPAIGRGLRPAHRHIAEDEADASGAHRQPVDVAADLDDVEEHALQGRRDRELPHGRADLTVGDQHPGRTRGEVAAHRVHPRVQPDDGLDE